NTGLRPALWSAFRRVTRLLGAASVLGAEARLAPLLHLLFSVVGFLWGKTSSPHRLPSDRRTRQVPRTFLRPPPSLKLRRGRQRAARPCLLRRDRLGAAHVQKGGARHLPAIAARFEMEQPRGLAHPRRSRDKKLSLSLIFHDEQTIQTDVIDVDSVRHVAA